MTQALGSKFPPVHVEDVNLEYSQLHENGIGKLMPTDHLASRKQKDNPPTDAKLLT